MFTEHPCFLPPENTNEQIWRYMDFTKLISIINSQSLFFTRADKFNDPFEGSMSAQNVKMRHIVYNGQIPTEQMEKLSNYRRELRRFMLINCWHMNDHESDAMWKLYLQSNEGIAIQSTFERLKNCFSKTAERIYIGKVLYSDYDKEWIAEDNLMRPFLHKRKSFEHEKEVRAILYKDPKSPIAEQADVCDIGIDITVDLAILVENIYISPLAQKWFFDLVKTSINKYGYSFNIHQSSLMSEPSY